MTIMSSLRCVVVRPLRKFRENLEGVSESPVSVNLVCIIYTLLHFSGQLGDEYESFD